MEDKKDLLENEVLEEANVEAEESSVSEEVLREREIEYRLSEINVIIDEYQNKLYDEEIETMSKEEYSELLQEQKSLKIELKEIRKLTRNSFWDKVKVWHIIYGIAQLAICFPMIGLMYNLCALFYSKLYEWFADSFVNLDPKFVFFLEVVMILAFPILNIFLSWILYANCVSKKKLDQIVFLSIWGGQILLTIISILLIFVG